MRDHSVKEALHRNNITQGLCQVLQVVHKAALREVLLLLGMALTILAQSAKVVLHRFQHCLSRLHTALPHTPNHHLRNLKLRILNLRHLLLLEVNYHLSSLFLALAWINSLNEMVRLFLWWYINVYKPLISLDWTRKVSTDYPEPHLTSPISKLCLTMVRLEDHVSE
jgi:hypothetical protein